MLAPLESVLTFWDGPHPRQRVPFGSTSFQHGAAVFEGVRCYGTPDGPAIFRLREHMTRMLGSASLVGIEHGYRLDELCVKVIDAAVESSLPNCYLRPVLFTPEPYLTLDLGAFHYILAIEVWPVPLYKDVSDDAAAAGSRLVISDWRRPSPSSYPRQAKATGIDVISALAKTAAAKAGYDDPIQLDPHSGRVAEATSSNIFLVSGGELVTPWLADNLLAGITRDSILTLADTLGIPVREAPVEVADLHAADEVFLAGTASQLVPVSAIGDRAYTARGPVFEALSRAFKDTASGVKYKHFHWSTPIGHRVDAAG